MHRPAERRRPARRKSAKRALKELAEASGGQDFYPKDLAEVERITPEVAHEIRNQYFLAYSPTNAALWTDPIERLQSKWWDTRKDCRAHA